jgi:Domain of unknown function (DUF4186)
MSNEAQPSGTGETKPAKKPLKLSCTQTQCAEGLHYFRVARRKKGEGTGGPCQKCGADLVDWERLHAREPADRDHVFETIQREYVRHWFWHAPFDDKAVEKALRIGRREMPSEVEKRLRAKVAPPSQDIRPWDGMQTPRKGDVIYYAQHATASCCRKCIERWHGIPPERQMTEEEVRYLEGLVLRYIDLRIPDLPNDGSPDVAPKRGGK